MKEKSDIKSRVDVELMVKSFYNKVLNDESIRFFFTEVIPVNWEKHLPVMTDFWESLLFDKNLYQGNPMEKHISLHQQSKLEKIHFEKWLQLFSDNIDEHFKGEMAEKAKQRAQSIATVMQLKTVYR